MAGCGGSSQRPDRRDGRKPRRPRRRPRRAPAPGPPHTHTPRPPLSRAPRPAVMRPTPTPPSQAALDSQALAYARCMRASGVPAFPDPKPGGGFVFQTDARGLDPSSPVFIAAQAKCQKLSPVRGLAPGTQTPPTSQALAQMVKVAAVHAPARHLQLPRPRTSIPSNLRAALHGGPGVISEHRRCRSSSSRARSMSSRRCSRAPRPACDFPLHNH